MKVFLNLCISILLLNSCSTFQNNAKFEFSDGKYKLKMDGKSYNCYVENHEDSIKIYELPIKTTTYLPKQVNIHLLTNQKLTKSSLDIDILTALFKVRPQVKHVLPTQLNTNFNGNIYVGYRTDIYQIYYKKNPLDVYQRKINHFGYSGGLFLGLSNTALNPSTTHNNIATEYDGLILQKGVAGILAVNKLTIGVGIGFDNLMDNNNETWIYENKPWFGLMLGLNLN